MYVWMDSCCSFLLHPGQRYRGKGPLSQQCPIRLPHILSVLLVTSLSCLPSPTSGATYRVVLVGPWACDPLYAKALPEAAARLAVGRMNRDPELRGGYWYEYTLVNEDCHTSRGLARFIQLEAYGAAFVGPFNPGYCASAVLLAQHWNKPILSWSCLSPHLDREGDMDREKMASQGLLRPLPLSSHVLFAVLRFFRWAHVAVVSASEELWEATGEELVSSLRALGLPVASLVTMDTAEGGARPALEKVRLLDRVKVVIMCMHSALIGGNAQRELLTTALDMRMVDRGYVFIPYDTLLYALPYRDASYPVLNNDTQLRRAYDAVLTITLDSDKRDFYQAFREAQENNEIRSSIAAEQVSPLFGTIYNSLYLLAQWVERARRVGNRWVTAETLDLADGDFSFQGFSQTMQVGGAGEGLQGRYVVLDTDGLSSQLYATHVLEASHINKNVGDLKYRGHTIHFPGRRPNTEPSCWFSPHVACSGGLSAGSLLSLFLLACLLGSFITFLTIRFRKKLWKVGALLGHSSSSKLVLTLDDVVFINTKLSRRKLNDESVLRSMLDTKTSFRSVSGRSYIYTSPEESNVALFEGDWVWVKKCLDGDKVSAVAEDTKTSFSKLRDMRHENLNLYLGLFLDSGIFAVVTEHCMRGSLQDLLSNPNMRLDWMFKSSLIMDLVRGMKYLHNHKIIHGRLKSRNCVVDGRFVLKVTEYGFNDILNSQNMNLDNSSAEDRLWTAPELLRDRDLEARGSFPGDVYSFSIIVQEVITRNTPYCMLDMPAQEIIMKVQSPPPLCRPLLTPEEAPVDCIQLMRQCWSEEPQKRPTFEEIIHQFRNLNKGRKTNIIDSMLRMLEQYSSNLEDLIRERSEELEVERQKTDRLLAQMLPRSVAQALKTGKPVEPEHFAEVTLYFSDIVGFTTISALSDPIEVVDLLNDLYTLFDAIIESHDVYKVETIGDAYMVASGVPNRNGSRHAAEVANMSLDILHCIGAFKMRHMPDVKVRIRIGLHTGPVVAGVVGLKMPRYCLFGDTVNTASRMESTGLPFRIHVNQSTVDVLRKLNLGYKLDTRGKTELKGKGVEDTYWLVGKDGYTKPLPVPPDLTPGASNHGISLDEIPTDRRQKFLDRQKKMQ